MNLLLDTHVILWVAENSPHLSARAKNAVLGRENEKYVSVVSVWEVAIKLGSRKLQLDGGLVEFFRIIDENNFTEISIERDHLSRLGGLGDFHKDPFDRLLIATALTEDFTIVTADENIHKYKVNWIW